MSTVRYCIQCHNLIDERSARIGKGVCGPCRLKQIERELEADQEYQLFKSLSLRVRESSNGVLALSEAERAYYLITVLMNEVDNGGLHQFFYNDSGAYCDAAEHSLALIGASSVQEVLRKAKKAAFSGAEVPMDIELRRNLLPFGLDRYPVPEAVKQLRRLDGQFYRAAKDLPVQLQKYATIEGLLARPGK